MTLFDLAALRDVFRYPVIAYKISTIDYKFEETVGSNSIYQTLLKNTMAFVL
jgi:hypothetical protein